VYVTHDQAEALTLADRIVVMREGVVQQIGAPEEIYEQPRNMFVASFLGNPPINYLEGRVEEDAGAVFFRCGATSLALPPSVAGRVLGQSGREAVLGLRAEDVDERASPREGEALHGRVSSVLPIGSDQFLGVDVDGASVFVRVGKEFHHRAGENIMLAVNTGRLHLFDKETGKSLVWD
jgi:multiple sugar transport system ATP-binding protein